MKILVTGSKGQLGTDIINELNNLNIDYIGVDIDTLDITDKNKLEDFFDNNNITHVIHTAAWTKVDLAEDENNKNKVYDINVNATKYLVDIAKKKNICIMYFSTDYVFGGEGDKPYNINDNKNPLGYYAYTKYEGEKCVQDLEKYFIIRISWVFGLHGDNFIKTMLKLAENHTELKVVNDQIGSPTYTYDLAKLVCEMIVTDKYGVYHATNEGYTSWADFSREIFKISNKNVKVIDVSTEEYGAKAKRPKNSRLDKISLDKAGFKRLRNWQDAVKDYINKIN